MEKKEKKRPVQTGATIGQGTFDLLNAMVYSELPPNQDRPQLGFNQEELGKLAIEAERVPSERIPEIIGW